MPKPIIRSWDVFDTLITRRCVRPEGIFDLMSADFGEDFRPARMQAELEARKCKAEISLEEIYDKLQIAMSWDTSTRQRALDLEIKTELDNVIPINENLLKVKDGDILVSDMYLSQEVILSLLHKAGLKKDVRLFVSNNGKGDGSMWIRLKKEFRISKHTGDNPRSDFLRPLRHGIPAAITETSVETKWERRLRCNGAPALSAYIREMRLRFSNAEKDIRSTQNAQIEANFPLLLLASAALVHWCDARGFSHALMCSRDCVLWTPLAEKMARHLGSNLVVEYFLTSRVAALKSSEEYLNYASKRIKPEAVVVDLSMTGISLAGLADRLKLKQVNAFVIAWQQGIAKSLYGEKYLPKAKVNIEFLTAEVIDSDLEAVNQALSPSVHDVHETSEGLRIKYAAENRSSRVLEAAKVQDSTFRTILEHVPGTVLEEASRLATSTRFIFLVRECAQHAGSFDTPIARARPGAALWNDPNGIKLNLSYTMRHPVQMILTQGLKGALKPFMPPGSFLHRYGKIVILAFRIAMDAKNRKSRKNNNADAIAQ